MRADESLVLAFDADCGRCRRVAATVARTGLEVLPLGDYRVREWRHEVYGDDPPHAPTLIAVAPAGDRDEVRAWHGPRLVAPLVTRLGARRTWTLLRALTAVP